MKVTQEEDDFMDLLIQLAKENLDHEGGRTVSDIKDFLYSIDHEQKDNASFAYNFFVWINEPMCIK